MSSINISTLVAKAEQEELINNITSSDNIANTELFNNYYKTLSHAVDMVYSDSPDDDLPVRLRASLADFSAFKAKSATEMVRGAVDIEEAKAALNTHNRYLAAEYNTARTRARSAKQFNEWSTEDNKDVFPNIKWLPSRSVNLRDDHIRFYNRVWAKSDPFWNTNQPGSLWNCKCDWQQTDEPVTDGNPRGLDPIPGLKGNPHKGAIFSDDSNYYPNFKKFDNEVQRQENMSRLKLKMDNCVYKYHGVSISAFADKKDLPTNITVCKLLNDSEYVKNACVRRHIIIAEEKNAELLIDGHVGEVKAILSNDVKNSFQKAISQSAEYIVLTTNRIKHLNINDLARSIGNRHMDFKKQIVKKCFVIVNDNIYYIDGNLFTNLDQRQSQHLVRQLMGLK